MLNTDGWAYLNIQNPLCAWAAYRGTLVSVPENPGMLSVWSASLLRAANRERIRREFLLERCRLQFYPEKVSRLRGMFCFADLASAEKAISWGNHFRSENLAELSFEEIARADRFDSNWITHHHFESLSDPALFGYWSGSPFPNKAPVWETIAQGRLIVLGTELRERAYSLVEKHMPQSTALLELGRLAAWVSSDLGNITAFLKDDGDFVELAYLLDMKEANVSGFIERFHQLRPSGHPMRPDAIEVFRQDKVCAPDFRPFQQRWPKSEFPFATIAQ